MTKVKDLLICVWHEEDGEWYSDCGFSFLFNEDTPENNGFIYCPKCGNKIKYLEDLV